MSIVTSDFIVQSTSSHYDAFSSIFNEKMDQIWIRITITMETVVYCEAPTIMS